MTESTDEQFEEFKDYIADEGLRLTTEREQIARTIFQQDEQFEAEDLLFKLRRDDKNVSRATIYRTLELLVNSGQLRKLDFGDGYSVYEVSHGSAHHSHLYCRHCGKVEEFSDEEMEQLQEAICEDRDFEPLEFSQKIYGYCSNCKNVVD